LFTTASVMLNIQNETDCNVLFDYDKNTQTNIIAKKRTKNSGMSIATDEFLVLKCQQKVSTSDSRRRLHPQQITL